MRGCPIFIIYYNNIIPLSPTDLSPMPQCTCIHVWLDILITVIIFDSRFYYTLIVHSPMQSESPGSKSKSGGAEASTTPERKRRRKSKIEPLDINEIEAGKPSLMNHCTAGVM